MNYSKIIIFTIITMSLYSLVNTNDVGKYEEIQLSGNSMYPYINNSQWGLFEDIVINKIKPGDVLVYCHTKECNKKSAHLFIENNNNTLKMIGLNEGIFEDVPIEMFKYKLIGLN